MVTKSSIGFRVRRGRFGVKPVRKGEVLANGVVCVRIKNRRPFLAVAWSFAPLILFGVLSEDQAIDLAAKLCPIRAELV